MSEPIPHAAPSVERTADAPTRDRFHDYHLEAAEYLMHKFGGEGDLTTVERVQEVWAEFNVSYCANSLDVVDMFGCFAGWLFHRALDARNQLARLREENATLKRGLVVCGHRSPVSAWPCSKEPGHLSGHENAFAYWPLSEPTNDLR